MGSTRVYGGYIGGSRLGGLASSVVRLRLGVFGF